MRLLPALLALCCSACACNPGGSDGGLDASDPSLVRGDYFERFLFSDGGVLTATVRVDLLSIAALVELEDGGFETLAGQGNRDGTFLIAGVPPGPWTLNIGDIFLNSEQRELHVGTNNLGRPGTFLANPDEGFRASLTNLAPWTDDDELQLISWNAGLDFFSVGGQFQDFTENAPDAGDTALDAAVIDLEGEPVVEAVKGDELFVVQLSGSRLDGGGTLRVVTRALSLRTTLDLGQLTPLSGAFTTLPLETDTLSVRTGEFARWAPEVNPQARAYEVGVLIDAHPGPFGRTTITSGTPDLAVARLPPDAGDVSLQVAFGNPYPPPWTTFLSGGALFEVPYSAPDGDGGFSPPRSEVGYVSFVVPRGTPGPLVPGLSPLRNVALDGQDAFVTRDGVKPQPVLSWDAPTVGVPTRVDVDVIELLPNINVTRRQHIASMRIARKTSSVRLPPGLLSPGHTYFLRLTGVASPPAYAYDEPRIDMGPPAAAASVMTAAFTVRNP